jgi:hypothetical protein
MARYLAIVERAFRGAVEEQYGHILAATLGFCKMGAPTDLLLRGNAVLYALRLGAHPRLQIGSEAVDTLPDYESALRRLIDGGAAAYVLADDCRRLRLEADRLVPGVREVARGDLASLVAAHDVVWYW